MGQFTDEEIEAMQNLSMQLVRVVNQTLPKLRSKGAAVQAIIIACAAMIEDMCPAGMGLAQHNVYAETCADELIEQLVRMHGK